MKSTDRDTLFRLFDAASQGTITAAESANLEAALASSAEIRKLWFLHQDMELGLEEWAASRSQESEALITQALARPALIRPQLVSPPKSAAPRAALRPFLHYAAAAALVATIGLALWNFAGKSSSKALATLTRSSNTRWENACLDPGTPFLSPRQLDLTSGIVELSMASGALVVFEGPGHMEILSHNAVRLHSGLLHATVPPAAKGFSVECNGFSVVDHGTEFGCLAPKSGTAEVHVFQGSVELKSWNNANRWLLGNQAIALRGQSLEPIPARPELFISPADLDHQQSTPGSLHQQASRILKNHPAAVVHFDASVAKPGSLPNSAAPDSRISIHNCTLTEGREPGRKALGFDGKSSQLTLSAARRATSLTLLAWLRTDLASLRQDLVSGTGPLVPGEIAWYLYYDNAIGFGAHVPVANLPGRGWRNLHSPPTKSLADWSLVATVVDTKAKTITHFLNGNVVGMGQVLLPPSLHMGPISIGAATPDRNTRQQTYHFQGAIDELAIIAAPLTAEEISRLYELGRPGPGTTPF